MNDLSMAFDPASLLAATHGFGYNESDLSPCWGTEGSVEQQRLAGWSKRFSVLAASLSRAMYAASTDNNYLEKFLHQYGYGPCFEQPLEGIGLAGLFDLRSDWILNGSSVRAEVADKPYQAVNVDSDRVRVFDIEHWNQPLVILNGYQGYELWLTMSPRPQSELDLFGLALQMLTAPRKLSAAYRSAQIPLLDLSYEPDLGWMRGLDLDNTQPGFDVVDRAYQLVRIKTACHDNFRGEAGYDKHRLVVNKPFMGFFIQTDPTRARELPQGCFWTNYRSWQPAPPQA